MLIVRQEVILVAMVLMGLKEEMGRKGLELGIRHTSFSNFLNSSSFCFRYSSISFWASERASFTFLVRSGGDQGWRRGRRGLGDGTFSGCES